MVGVEAGRDVEVGAQAGVLLQPVFVVGLDPVDLAELEGEPGHGAVDFVVVLEVADLVVAGEAVLQLGGQVFVVGVGDGQDVDAVGLQGRAEMPVLLREMRRDEYEVHERICFVFFINSVHGTVGDQPGFAVEFGPAVPDEDVAAVGEGVEAVLPALGDDDVLEQTAAVQDVVPDLVVVRDDLDVRQAEAREPAAVMRVYALAGEFRMGVDPVGAVHGAGAAAHDDAVVSLQDIPEADFMDKGVLRGDMAAAEDDPVRFRHQRPDIGGVAAVEHGHGGHLDTGIADAKTHSLEHRVREGAVVGGGADQQGPGVLRQGGLDSGEKAVVFGEMVLAVAGRTASQKKSHRSAKIVIFCVKTRGREKGRSVRR